MKTPPPKINVPPSIKLPPWQSRKPEDRQRLRELTIAILNMDKEQAITDAFIHFGDGGPKDLIGAIRRDPPPIPSIECAEQIYAETGDMTLLRRFQQANPKYRKYRVPLPKGAPVKERSDKFWEAALDYKAIMQIWDEPRQETFEKRRRYCDRNCRRHKRHC